MKVRTLGLGLVIAGFTLASVPAMAQDPKSGGGAPGGGASERSGGGGAAASSGSSARSGGGGGGGGSVATGGGGGGSSSSSAGFSSPSGNNAFASDLGISRATARGREEAPARRSEFSANRGGTAANDGDQKASPRSNGSGGNGSSSGGGDRAVPRGSSSGSSGSNGSNGATGARTRPTASNDNNAAGAREVPNWSRPRGDRPATGVAVDRVGPPPDPDRDNYHGRYYNPYYYGGGYYNPYSYYNYYYPYSWGLGYGLYSGFGWSPYFGYPVEPGYGGYGGYSSGVYNTADQGHLKLKVKPRNAKVYVDGYFVGLVDQFDGAFQKLALNGGRHKVEVRAEGFETAEFDVLITPDQTITFQGDLKRIQ